MLLSREGFEVVGLDLSPIFIKRAKKKEAQNLKFVCADILRIPFKDEVFDSVSIFLVIEHIPDIPRVLKEMHRITKLGGRINILSPNLLSPFNILLPLLDSLFGKKTNFLFGVKDLIGIVKLFFKNTALLIKKMFTQRVDFTYRIPVLDNRIDFIADNDAVYLACPVDFKHYFKNPEYFRIINYQGYGKIGKILPDFSTGIHLSIEKLK